MKFSYIFKPITLMLAAMLTVGCTGETVEKITQPDIPVQVIEVSIGEISSIMTYAGRVSPGESVYISSKLSGKVKEIFHDIGDRVNEGDILFTLDESDIDNQIKQLEASLRTAESGVASAQNSLESVTGGQYDSQLLQLKLQIENYEKQLENSGITLENARIALENTKTTFDKVSVDFNNAKTLYNAGVISKNEYDKAELGYTQAEAGVESSENAYEQAKIGRDQIIAALEKANETYELTTGKITDENTVKAQLGINQAATSRDAVRVQLEIAKNTVRDTAVTAPMSGVISAKTAKAGEFTSTQLAAYTIINIDTVKINVNVSELIINKIYPGLAVDVSVSAVSKDTYKGIIKTVSPAADASGAYPVSIELENKDGLLKPGMFAEVHFVRESSDKTLILPRSSVLEDTDKRHVFINDGGVAKKVIVTTGIDNGKSIEITTGLKEKDQVIVKGQTYVSDGDAINIIPPEEEKAG